MKYIKVLIISILLSPILVLAYSENIIPGGENIGIEAHTEGIIVVGFYKVNDKYNLKKKIKRNNSKRK